MAHGLHPLKVVGADGVLVVNPIRCLFLGRKEITDASAGCGVSPSGCATGIW